jgi:DNA-binding HxlR family transcriptional regulator
MLAGLFSGRMDDEATLEVCPRLTLAFDILGKRWSALILDVLSHRPARFSEINNAVPRLSERVLSARLTELADAGLVDRIQDDSGGHHYELTTTGERLRPALDAIRTWANDLHTARAS